MIAWRFAVAAVLGLIGSAGAQPAASDPVDPDAPVAAEPAAPEAPAAAEPAAAEPADPDAPADPEAPLPSVPEPDIDPRAAGYPRSLVDRPLVLSNGMVEGSLALGVSRADRGLWGTRIAPSLRYAAGRFEIKGGASLLLDDLYSDAIVAVRFAPNPDMTVGLQLVIESIGSTVLTTTPRLLLGRKQLLTETVAVESAFAPGFARSAGATAFVASGEVRVQVQVAPLYAVQARAALHVRYLETEGTTLGHNYGLGVLASLTPTIDLMPSLNLFAADDDYVGVVFSLELNVRNRR